MKNLMRRKILMKARSKSFLSESYCEGGSISWSVSTETTDGIFHDSTLESEVMITDCNSTIKLDFDCTKIEHIPKRIKKLNVLISELEYMREALEAALKEKEKKKKFYY
jgi:hypothetical protein